MMSNAVCGESTFENGKRSGVWITLVMDHDACPAETIRNVRYYSGGVES